MAAKAPSKYVGQHHQLRIYAVTRKDWRVERRTPKGRWKLVVASKSRMDAYVVFTKELDQELSREANAR